jgi:transposase
MDRACEGEQIRHLAPDPGFPPVVPPNPYRLQPREYNRVMDAKRNEVERLLRRPKGFRRIFSRYDKLDAVFTALIHFALIIEALR